MLLVFVHPCDVHIGKFLQFSALEKQRNQKMLHLLWCILETKHHRQKDSWHWFSIMCKHHKNVTQYKTNLKFHSIITFHCKFIERIIWTCNSGAANITESILRGERDGFIITLQNGATHRNSREIALKTGSLTHTCTPLWLRILCPERAYVVFVYSIKPTHSQQSNLALPRSIDFSPALIIRGNRRRVFHGALCPYLCDVFVLIYRFSRPPSTQWFRPRSEKHCAAVLSEKPVCSAQCDY